MAVVFRGKRILLGVTGGIAAYKAADLASKLVQEAAQVEVILTESATRFVTADTFAAITGRTVHTSVFERWGEGSLGHITLGHEADILLVVPATADSIARLAAGNASDMLGAVALATPAPILVAPAMEHQMYHHPATQRNLVALREWGYRIIGPDSGHLASGESGDGRLVAPEQLLGAVRQELGRTGCLAGKKVVVSAGGTREPLDPVRFLGNSSSGLMGYALAQAAIDQGADVTLVSGPVCLVPPFGVDFLAITTAIEMQSAMEAATADADVLLMAAAVADFRPKRPSDQKIKKGSGSEVYTFELERNPDVLQTLQRPGMLKVGFAAETDDLVVNARAKLEAKGLDLIIANDAENTIGAQESEATIIDSSKVESLPRMPKEALADLLIERVAAMLATRI